MSQVDVSKSVAYSVIGSNSDEVTAPKVVAYMILVPGEIEDDSNRQGHVYSQIIRRT